MRVKPWLDRRGGIDSNVSVEFMYRDRRVVVRSDGWVQLYEPDDSA